MAYGLNKFHESTEIVDNNGATQGTIVHDGSFKTINSTSIVGSGNIEVGGQLTINTLALRTATGPFTITPSQGLDSILVIMFVATGTRLPTMTTRLSQLSTSASGNKLYQGSSEVAAFQRDSAGTQIIINSMSTGNFNVYELVVE